MLAAVTLDSVVAFVQAGAALAAFGPTLAYAPAATWVRRHQAHALPVLHAGTAWASGALVAPAVALALVAGLYGAVVGGDRGPGWILGALVLPAAVLALHALALVPRSRAAADLARADLGAPASATSATPRLGPAYETVFRGLVRTHLLASGLVLAGLFLVVTRPF